MGPLRRGDCVVRLVLRPARLRRPNVTRVPGAQPVPVAVEITHWARVYNPPLTDFHAQLERRNLRVVARKDAAVLVNIDPGVGANRHAMDIVMTRGGRQTCLGRIWVPSFYRFPFYVLEEWVAEIIAQGVAGPDGTGGLGVCGT